MISQIWEKHDFVWRIVVEVGKEKRIDVSIWEIIPKYYEDKSSSILSFRRSLKIMMNI
jgi:hypothetical protein